MLLKWIKRDRKKAVFAVDYLLRKQMLIRSLVKDDPFETIKAAEQLWSLENWSQCDYELLEMKMKNAWQTHKYRHGPRERKPYAFSMRKEAKKKIDDIAIRAGRPVGHVLEELILGYDLMLEQHRQEVQSLKQQLNLSSASSASSVYDQSEGAGLETRVAEDEAPRQADQARGALVGGKLQLKRREVSTLRRRDPRPSDLDPT